MPVVELDENDDEVGPLAPLVLELVVVVPEVVLDDDVGPLAPPVLEPVVEPDVYDEEVGPLAP